MSKIFVWVISVLLFSITPMTVQSFPINGLMIANSMTFATITVTIIQNADGKGAGAYSPDTITIQSGDTVIWYNADGSMFNHHTATCGSGSPCGQWSTDTLSGQGTYSSPISYTSFAVGTTGYYCKVHGYPAMYGGVIRVVADVQQWEKMSSAEREKELEYHPLQGAFGLTFVPPNNQNSALPSSAQKSQEVQVTLSHESLLH